MIPRVAFSVQGDIRTCVACMRPFEGHWFYGPQHGDLFQAELFVSRRTWPASEIGIT
jgi:hypothetical protein